MCVSELSRSFSGTWRAIVIECIFFQSFFIICWDLLYLRVTGGGMCVNVICHCSSLTRLCDLL